MASSYGSTDGLDNIFGDTNGLSSDGLSSDDIGTVLVFDVIFSIVALVLSIIVYVKFAQKDDDIGDRQSWTWRRFFSFDVTILSGVVKFLYIFLAFEILASALAFIVMFAMDGALSFVAGLIATIIIAAIVELLLRLVFELIMMFAKLTDNSTSIKRILARDKGDVGFYEQGNAVNKVFSSDAVALVDQENTASRERADADGEWTCSECGKTQTGGRFCGECGKPRK